MLSFRNKKFYLNGEELVIRSGSLHYFRALPAYWESLLKKFRAAGLNCVETYCAWNLHEPEPGRFDFTGNADIRRFLETAAGLDLKVIVRPGPFICAEWENGGLPAWLLKDPSIRLRVNHEGYMSCIKRYYHELFAVLRPYLEVNGGPIIAMAIENEYGSFGDDFSYLAALEQIYRNERMDCLYFSADGETEVYLCTGSLPHILKAVDFTYQDGKSIADRFAPSNKYLNGEAPNFVVEYWAGQHSHWGRPFRERDDEQMRADFCEMIASDVSFNDYMFFGGTNFGLMNGANVDFSTGEHFRAELTTYDYDAALTEWGDYTPRYFAIRDMIAEKTGEPLAELPARPSFQKIGRVKLTESASLFAHPDAATHHRSLTAEPMEQYGQGYGYIRYRKTMSYNAPYEFLTLRGIHDRAHVYLNGKLIGIRMRDEDESPIELANGLHKGDVLDVFVENMGRINFSYMVYKGDRKGITEGIFGHNRLMTDFEIDCFDLRELPALTYSAENAAALPAFFKGSFRAEPGKECFVRFDSFRKGLIYVNGFLLGRYWERGPQEALYLPGALLQEENEIVVFETDGLRGDLEVEITDRHGIVGKTHG